MIVETSGLSVHLVQKFEPLWQTLAKSVEVVHAGVLHQYSHRPEGDMVDMCGRFCRMQSVPKVQWWVCP